MAGYFIKVPVIGKHKDQSGGAGSGIRLSVRQKRKSKGVQGAGDNLPKGFRAACETAGVAPTRRQLSKWKMGKGAAYKARKGVANAA